MEFLIIASFDAKKLKHAEHVQLHTNIRNVINQAGAETIGVSQAVFMPYLQAIAKEQDIVYKASGSAFTAEMEKADQERDNCFRRVRRKLEVARYENPESAAYKAADVIEKHLLSQYTGSVSNLPLQEETAVLTGFVQDCRTLLTSAQVKAVGIDDDLDELEAANQHFNQVYQERVAEKADTSVANAQMLRAATDAAYNQLSVCINAAANNPVADKAEQTELARGVVSSINVVIAEAKQRVNQRLSGAVGVVTDVVFDGGMKLPVLLNDVDRFQVIGTKLTSSEMKLTLIEQVNGKPGQVLVKSLDQFSADYSADFEVATDTETGIMTVTVSDWSIGGDKHLTLTAVACG